MWYLQVDILFCLFSILFQKISAIYLFSKKILEKYSALADLKYFCNSTKTSSVLNKKMSLKMLFVLPLLYLFPTDSKSVDNYLIKKNGMWNIRTLSWIEG